MLISLGQVQMGAQLSAETVNSVDRALRTPGGARPHAVGRRALAMTVKRAIDIFGALGGLTVLSPVLALLALWIVAVDPGSPIFWQTRSGRGGRPFTIYKFRTVRLHHCDLSGHAMLEEKDRRFVPGGHFLRKSRLDELPQLFNVLAGDMSMVGPRPHIPDMRVEGRDYADLVPNYLQRTAMAPGLTGWAQCHGLNGPVRSATEAAARIEYDLDYLRHFSILLDLKIMAMTIFHVIALLRPKPPAISGRTAPLPSAHHQNY